MGENKLNKGTVVLEESSKNIIGRPRKYNKEFLSQMSGICSDIKTERGLIEYIHSSNSHGIIARLYAKNSLANKWAEYYVDKNHKHVFHKSILAALGRIEDESDLITLAKKIAENKTSTIRAVAAIRGYRLNKPYQVDPTQLLLHLELSINQFLQKHPSASVEMIVSCLRDYAEALEVKQS